MATLFYRLTVTEYECVEVGEWTMIHGKGRIRGDLVYFQLDAGLLRKGQRESLCVGGVVTVTTEDILGGTGAFAFAS